MKRDKRYEFLKIFFEKGRIRCFNQIFDTIPRSILAKDLGMKITRFNKLMDNLLLFKLEEIFTIAFFVGIDEFAMVDLVVAQHESNKKNNKNDNSIQD